MSSKVKVAVRVRPLNKRGEWRALGLGVRASGWPGVSVCQKVGVGTDGGFGPRHGK